MLKPNPASAGFSFLEYPMFKVNIYTFEGEGIPGMYVDHDDYDALEADCERLKNSLLAITARHFAESWKKRTSDAELEQYLSAGIAQLEAEREKLHMQLAACGVVALANTPESAAQARQMHPDYMSASCSDVADAVDREMTLRQQRDALAAELAAIKGQEVDGGN